MCEKCQNVKNLWFHRIVKGWTDISIHEVQEAWDNAFGDGKFDNAYHDGTINPHAPVTCLHCGVKYFIWK